MGGHAAEIDSVEAAMEDPARTSFIARALLSFIDSSLLRPFRARSSSWLGAQGGVRSLLALGLVPSPFQGALIWRWVRRGTASRAEARVCD